LTDYFVPRAIVFDMDGLLLDTERVALATFEATCDQHNIVVDRALYDRCIGTSSQGTAEILREALGSALYERISRDWSARYRARVTTRAVDIKAGAVELLNLARRLGLPLALATSTHTELANTKLRLAGLDGFFASIVGGDTVTRTKPHPEPYLTATRALGFAPDECWAIEDSENGVRAAHAAGLFVFQVPDLVQPSASVRSLGHSIVDSLSDIARLLAEKAERRTVT